MAWQTPKIDWTTDAGVADLDMNRIEGNAVELKKAATIDIVDSAGIITATNVEGALQELATDLITGKTGLATALTNMGQTATTADSLGTMATKIAAISTDATAGTGDVIAGKTFYQGGVKRTGTIIDKAGTLVNVPAYNSNSDNGVDCYPPAGYYNGTTAGVYVSDPYLNTANIKYGTSIFNVAGSFTSDGNISAGDVINGKIAYSQGNKITGSLVDMPNNVSAASFTLGSGSGNLQVRIPTGAYRSVNGTSGYPEITVYDPDFVANNIRNSVQLFGLWGNLIEGAPNASGNVTNTGVTLTVTTWTGAANTSTASLFIEVSGLSFQPRMITATMYSATYGFVMMHYLYSGLSHVNSLDWHVFCARTDMGQNFTGMLYHVDGFQTWVNNGNFRLPVLYSNTWNWYAYA